MTAHRGPRTQDQGLRTQDSPRFFYGWLIVGACPLLAGLVFDATGTYAAAFLFFAGSYGLSALLTSQARPPVRHPLP